MLEQARSLGIAIYFSTPKKSDLLNADEIFLTKSTTGITPVVKIDQLLIGSGKVGVMTKRLMENLSIRSLESDLLEMTE